MGVFILALIALAVYAVASTPVPTSIATDTVSSMVANPELRLATRYAEALADAAQSRRLSTNPELMVVRHYAGPVVTTSQSAFLSANPELIIYRVVREGDK